MAKHNKGGRHSRNTEIEMIFYIIENLWGFKIPKATKGIFRQAAKLSQRMPLDKEGIRNHKYNNGNGIVI